MKRAGAYACVILFAVIAAGCGSPEGPAGVDLPELPRFEQIFDCQASPEQCIEIQAGIDYLKQHANAMCRISGLRAQERYDAVSGEGFRNEPPAGTWDMSVYTTAPGSNIPLDAYTNVHPSFWNTTGRSDASTGALIAHEEVHHAFGGESLAQSHQDACLNPQA